MHVGILSGWLTFFISLALIGLQTALMGDLAAHFGCSVGLADALNAISFVSIGVSLPGYFISTFVFLPSVQKA